MSFLKVVINAFLWMRTAEVYINFPAHKAEVTLSQAVTEIVFNAVLCLVLFFIYVKIKTLCSLELPHNTIPCREKFRKRHISTEYFLKWINK